MGLEMGLKDLSDVGIEGERIGFTSMGSLDIPIGSAPEISDFFQCTTWEFEA